MSWFHIETHSLQPAPRAVKLRCLLCKFLEPCTDATYFTHLRSRHLRDNQKVQCPFKGCSFESFFHAIGGYPPDPLHDILEGIVPIELSLCIADLVAKKCITLKVIKEAIKTFPYACTDKTDRPQPIVKGLDKKGTIGGNGHENWCLIRLLPLLIGHCIPEGNDAWETPKHHYIEHYSELIKLYGPLCEVWTMRLEGKHKFFKKVVRDAQNFKNVPMTLAVRHQKAVSYQLDCSSFYKPEFEMAKMASSTTMRVILTEADVHLVSLPSRLSENLNDTVSTADTELLSTSSTEARKPREHTLRSQKS
ncbi:hypothetical protein SRHO_G00222620 [Serrasalmus rhombeus]